MSGTFVNPGNKSFLTAIQSQVYVDKTDFLAYTNSVLNSKDGWICNSRPRRFGKSTTVDMLTAYYSRGCDSSDIFRNFKITKSADYSKHLNKHNVICFDVQWLYKKAKNKADIVNEIQLTILQELQMEFPSAPNLTSGTLTDALALLQRDAGESFIIIIDEWDMLIRDESVSEAVRSQYIDFLSALFKGTGPAQYIELAYLTGILPIIKIRTESALNNFNEFTMLGAGPLAPFIGFSEEEVRSLCEQHNISFINAKRWYDGYTLGDLHLYNPRAIVQLVSRKQFQSYWSETGTFLSIKPYLDMNFSGLKDSVVAMLAGDSVFVTVSTYQNDLQRFNCRDDVLTLLIHLGYLSYDADRQTVSIPNEEIREELLRAVAIADPWMDLIELQKHSAQLMEAVFDCDEAEVARWIDYFHESCTSILQYNDENSLSCALSIGFLSAMRWYYKPVREMPAGRGFADLVYIPKATYAATRPAIIAELKWDKSSLTALDQIKERRYLNALQGFSGQVLLVGINYDRKAKIHECRIERVDVSTHANRH